MVMQDSYAAIGVMEMDRLVRLNVLVFAHACEDPRAQEPLKVPAAAADHSEMCDKVSEVPPFVHDEAMDVIALEPPEAAAIVA